MLCIQLLFLLATIGSYVSEAKPTDTCDKSHLYETQADGKSGTVPYYCDRYWLCMKIADGSYDWVEEKCMGNLIYDGKACTVGTTKQPCFYTPASTALITASTPATQDPSTCNKDTLYTTKPATLATDTHHYWLCMKSSSGGYEWIYEKCMGTLVYDKTKKSCEVPTKSPGKDSRTTPMYNP